MFSTPPEVRTFAALHDALAPLGYTVSQKARVLDCVQAAAANPQATTPVGPTLGDALVPALREAAGPFGPAHPWLHKGDWSHAFRGERQQLVSHEPVHARPAGELLVELPRHMSSDRLRRPAQRPRTIGTNPGAAFQDPAG